MEKKTNLIFILTGIITIIGGIIAIFLLYDDFVKPKNFYYTIPIAILIFGIGFLYLIYGLLYYKYKTDKKTVRAKFALLFGLLLLISIPILETYFIIDATQPRKIYVRQESIQLDQDYEVNSIYGNIRSSLDYLLSLPPSNISDPLTYAWGESYYLRNQIHFYNVTKNATLFDYIMSRIAIMIENSDWNEDGIPGYGSDKYEGYYVEYVVWDGMIVHPMAEAARLILSNSTLNATYNSNALEIVDVAEKIIQKWNKTHWYEADGPYGRYGYYLSPPLNDNRPIYNRINAIGRLCYELYQITNNNTYKEMVIKMGRFLKMGLKENSYVINGESRVMYTWPYSECKPSLKIGAKCGESDTSHGSIDVDFADYCYQLGVVFTEQDMERFSNMFFDVVFKGFEADPIFADDVSGEDKGDNYYKNIRDGYHKMWKYYRDPDLALFISKKSNEILVNQSISSVGVTRSLTYLLEVENNQIWK